MIIEPLFELETGFIDLVAYVDADSYRDMYVDVTVDENDLPGFMDVKDDQLLYEPKQGDYGSYDITVVYEKASTELEVGYKVTVKGTLRVDQFLDAQLLTIADSLKSQEDMLNSDLNQMLLAAWLASEFYIAPEIKIQSFNN